MSLNYSEAVDRFFNLIRTNLSDDYVANVDIYFQGVPSEINIQKSYGRFFIEHTSSSQRSIGGRLYERRGFGGVELFEVLGKDLTDLRLYANEVKNIFQDSDDTEFYFTNITISEIGVFENKFFQLNVITEFLYFEAT